MFQFNAAIAAGVTEGVGLLALLHERTPVLFRLKLQGVTALSAIKQSRQHIGTASRMLRLNPSAFKQSDDFGMLFRGLDCRVYILNDDPVFTGNYFERGSFAFLVQSTACFAIDYSA